MRLFEPPSMGPLPTTPTATNVIRAIKKTRPHPTTQVDKHPDCIDSPKNVDKDERSRLKAESASASWETQRRVDAFWKCASKGIFSDRLWNAHKPEVKSRGRNSSPVAIYQYGFVLKSTSNLHQIYIVKIKAIISQFEQKCMTVTLLKAYGRGQGNFIH